MKVILDLPEDVFNKLKTDIAVSERIVAAIVNGYTITPDTKNGEVFKVMFPDVERYGTVLIDKNENIIATNVNIGWWGYKFN